MTNSEAKTMYETAVKLLASGISVIPTGGGHSERAKHPHSVALKMSGHFYLDSENKERGSWKSFQTTRATEQDLKVWYLQEGARGLGMVTGAISGFVVIDVDPEGLPLLERLGWKPHVYSPSGGAHIYVNHPGWFVQSNASKNKKTLPPGFDVRGDGGYIMLPPSRNPKGHYRRTDQKKPLRIDEIPEVVEVDGVTYQLRAALGLTTPAPAPAPTGPERAENRAFDEDDRCPMSIILDRAADYASDSRNKGAFMLGLWANANDYRLDEALNAAWEFVDMVQGVKASPFTIEEAHRSIRSAYTYPKKDPWVKREEE